MKRENGETITWSEVLAENPWLNSHVTYAKLYDHKLINSNWPYTTLAEIEKEFEKSVETYERFISQIGVK